MKWTEENIIKFINKNTEYNFVNFIEYNGIYSKLIINCNKHGNFEMLFSNLKNNINRQSISCKKCSKENRSKKFRLSINEVREKIEARGYKLLSDEYINNSTNLYLQCPCGYKFYMTFSNFIYQNQDCPKCAQIKRIEKSRHTYEYVKNYIESSNEYILLSDNYINAHNKLNIHCIKHDYDFLMSYHDFQQGSRCQKCSNENRALKLRHDYDYVKNYIQDKGDELLSTEYKNNLELLYIKCGKRGHEYNMSFGNYISGHRCPFCNESMGENKISDILDQYNILYISEYSFDDCKYRNKLRFDFYLPDYNTCIEFDGIQHYEVIEYFGGQENFNEGQLRDSIKNNYCLENNIRLIRIPYWDFDNIENILYNELILNKQE